MNEPTCKFLDAATELFNLPDYIVQDAVVATFGQRRVSIESRFPASCPDCGVISPKRKEKRLQRVRDIPVAGPVEVWWTKFRFFCQEPDCARKSFFESTPQIPRFARSTHRLREELVDAVVRSRRAISETAGAFDVSWWLVRKALNEAVGHRLPNVDLLAPRRLGIDEHRFRSVRFFRDPETEKWTRYEPWMTTIVDLDTGRVLGVVDGRDSTGVGAWLMARPVSWRLGVHVVAIDPSAAFRKALRLWLPRSAVSIDHFHLVVLANQALTEVRQRLSQELKGRRGRTVDPSWAHRMLLLRGAQGLTDRAAHRLQEVFTSDDPSGQLRNAWRIKEHLRLLLRTGSLADAAREREQLRIFVSQANLPETNRLMRTVDKWWNEIETLIVTGATTAKVEANNTTIKNIKRSARGYRNPDNYRSVILLTSAAGIVA